jgi:hypothetical protein
VKRWTIYCHTHVDSGRRYIGLTGQTMEKRWKNHINAAKSSKGGRWHFPNAIRKYGPDAFSHKIIRVFDNLDDANLAEKCLIKRWKTRDPKFGFNVASGGYHVPHPKKNPWDRPEYRAKALINLSSVRASITSQQHSIYSNDYWQKSESREKASLLSKNQWKNSQFRAKVIMAVKSSKATPESKAKRSESAKAQWKNRKIAMKTHCKNNHNLNENAYIGKHGLYVCRVCCRDRYARRIAKHKLLSISVSSLGGFDNVS